MEHSQQGDRLRARHSTFVEPRASSQLLGFWPETRWPDVVHRLSGITTWLNMVKIPSGKLT
jgi:hypothetical protein